MDRFVHQIAIQIAAHVEASADDLVNWLEFPPDSALGDVALPCFRLAKTLRKAPQAIAIDLADKLGANPLFIPEPVGPYLNMRLHRGAAWKAIRRQIADDDGFFTSRRGLGQTVAIDLSSPNIAKPFSMGHLRSTVIGTALANILASDGYRPLRINHLGDWGTQFGKIIVAYRRFGDETAVRAQPIQELNALYVRFHEEAAIDPALDDEARAAFKRLEDGDAENLALWRWIVSVSKGEFQRTYELLGTAFDHTLGESFYNDKMPSVVQELADKQLLTQSAGAEVVMLEEDGLPPCLIRRSDGATLYPTRDLAAALYRHRSLGADRLLYVVGAEQRLHFQQVFAVLARMGYGFASRCSHIAFGMMLMDGKKMSTRKGQVVRLQEVLEEAVARARAIIAEKNPDLREADRTARDIGVGAVIFNDLKTNRLHDVDFTMETALAFEGETGPYVQYTHARACSVLRRAGLLAPETGSPAALVTPAAEVTPDDSRAAPLSPARIAAADASMDTSGHAKDQLDDAAWELAKLLSRYADIRLRAADEMDPSLIAKHALDISQAFNRFYHDCPILSAEEPLRAFRLALTDATRVTLRASLELLGIAQPAEI